MDHERRIALKFAYDGSGFHGFQRQPEKITVEGELVRALARVGAIRSARECGYRGSSRTDRGVSALGNIISLRTSFPPSKLCSAVNSEMEGVWAYSAIEVPDDFNPRAARQRWYRYYLANTGQNPELMRELASRFVGVHDFSGYARKDKRNPMRKIDSIEISDAGVFYAVDFRAENFLWNMVRRIVWMISEGSTGRMPVNSIGPKSPDKPVRVGLSPPEYLVLMDIDCGVEFPTDGKVVLGISHALVRKMREHGMRLEFAKILLDAL
ncbi:MAG: tRNA pseudouridine(38-40) synthase TruA [Candidatus Thermoplasmatota archaeon]|nr:tRNA pseudouridine(38-40) synthase TruA [Candidatus Thermoplasmatota archaeon]